MQYERQLQVGRLIRTMLTGTPAVWLAVLFMAPAASGVPWAGWQDSDQAPAREAAADDAAPADEPVPQDGDPPIEGLTEPSPDEPGQVPDESAGIDPANKDALAWYMAGQKAMRQGELQAAADAFEKAAAADDKSTVPLRAWSMVLFRLGRAEEGLQKARMAIDRDSDDYLTRLQLALILGSARRLPDALALLDDALESKKLVRESYDFIRLHQVRGAVSLEMRDAAGAATSYEFILKALQRPEEFKLTDKEHQALLKNRATGYESTGRVLLMAGRLPKAVEAFEALGRTEQDAPGDYNLLLARALYQQDKLEDCERNLNRYFETGRRSNDSLQLLRDLYSASERSEALVPRLRELATDSMDETFVRMVLGQTLLDQGLNDEAEETYQAILDSTGDSEAYLGLVRVGIARRDATALIATLNRAARARISAQEIGPLADSIAAVDDFARETVAACLKLYQEKPDDLHPAVPWFCSRVAGALELRDDESQLLKAALELNPERELLLTTLDQYGMNRLQAADYPMAARIFEQMLAMPGLPPQDRVNTLFRISAAYASIKDLGAARRALTEALRMVPEEPQLLSRLALVEAADGRLDVAEELLRNALERLQGNPELELETRLQLAGVCAQASKWDKAIEQYRLAADAEAADAETIRLARMGLSNACVQNGDMAQGEKILEEIYDEDPSDPGVNNDLGYLWADQGKNLEQAEKMIRLAVEAQPENPAYLDSLGWVLFKQGRLEEALVPLEKANADPDYQDATLLEHQGDVHQALKQPAEAKAMWDRALKVEQDASRPSEDVLKRLKEKLAAPADPETSSDVTPESK